MLASSWARALRSSPATFSRGVAATGSRASRRWLSAAAAVKEPQEEVSTQPTAASDTPEFSTLKDAVSENTLKAIVGRPFNLTHMSPVQAAVLPLLPGLSQPYDLESDKPRDMLVRAKTGTGKTLGFLVPAVEARIRALKQCGKEAAAEAGQPGDRYTEERAVRRMARADAGCLIISPTRELATQIANAALQLSEHHPGFEVRLFVGGNSKQLQLRDWHKGRRDIVVGTPGRIRDLVENEPAVAESIAKAPILILDEADTLLDMGFRDDLDAIVSKLPPTPERQTFMFSATVSPAIRQVARTYLAKNHMFINCVDESAPPTHINIPQYHTVLPTPGDQLPHLLRLLMHDQLTNGNKSKTIVFSPTTKMTQLYSTLFRNLASTLPGGTGTRVYEIHSKLNQGQRDRASRNFREQSRGPSILITSDVSARGLDYPGVTRVIQIGCPSSPEAYVHRAGRTGRGNDVTGRVDLVLLPWEVGYVTWQLTEMPLKPLTTGELQKQVTELAQRLDSGELQVKINNVKTPYSGVHESMPSKVAELQTMLDEDAITETLFSLFGYYGPKAGELRVQRNVVVEGLKNWAAGSMGLPKPPYISPAMLAKTGLSDKPEDSRSSYKRKGSSPWDMRGKQGKSKDGRDYAREPRSYGQRSSDSDRRPFGSDRGARESSRGSRDYDRGSRDYDRGSRDYDRGSRGSSRGYDRESRDYDKPRERRRFDREPRESSD